MRRLYTIGASLLFFLLLSFLSFDSYSQSCNGADGTNPVGGGLVQEAPGDACANIATVPGRMRIEANNVDDGGDPNNIGFEIDWNDGSALQIVTFAAGQVTRPAANSYQSTVTHFFPRNGTNVKCEYFPTVRLRVMGVACATTLGIPPRFVKWNTEGQNTGILRLSETTTNVVEYLICRGIQTTVTFTDRSTMNCVPPAMTLTQNNRIRTRRFTYGTTNTITSATGVQVAGIVQTYPFQGVEASHGANGPGTYTPPAPTQSLAITIPADAAVGQIFEIRLDYWNLCNPFVGPNGTANPPVSTTARIRIVDQPVAPTVVNNTVCNATNPLPGFQTTVAGTPTVTWYRDNAGVPGTVISSGTSKTLATSSYPGGITNTTPGLYRVWVSYNAVNNPDGKTCESPIVPVTLTIVEDLAQPSVITGTSDICNNQSIVFSLPAAAGTTTNGGAVDYEWSSTGGSGLTLTGTTATTATFNINIGGSFQSATRTIRVRRVYSTSHSGTGCPSSYRTFPITVYGPSVGGTTAGGGSFCQGANVGAITLSGERGIIQRWEVSTNGGTSYNDAGLGTSNTINPGVLANGSYLYRAVVANGPCAEANSTTTAITVSANPSPATTGADQALCTNILTSNALGGSDPAPGSGLWTVVTKPAGSNVTFNSGANARNTTVDVDKVGAYTLRWTVTNGTCVSSDDIIVDFGTDPGVQSAGANTPVCGTSFTLSGSAPTIGTGTWTLVTAPAGGTVSFDNINLPGATVTLTPAGSEKFGAYTFRWSVVSGTCAPRTANVIITFNRPATATAPANFNTCVDGTTLAPIAITGTVGAGAGAGQTGRWEIVSGTGTFTSNNSNPGLAKVGASIADSYKPSAGDFAVGSAQVRLVAIDPDGGGGPCGNVNSTTLLITFDKVPTNVNAGPDQLKLCAPTATLAALVPTNGTGVWSDPLGAGVSFTNVNDRNTTISNLPIGTTTLRWTVSSSLNGSPGGCSTLFDEVQLTRNPLPSINNILPELCEQTAGGGTANNVLLTTNDAAITGGAANTTVAWFTDAGPAGPITPSSTPQTISNLSPASLTFFTRVTNSITTCTNDGTVTYTINPLPDAIDFAKSFCEEFPVGSNKVDNIDLTAADIIAGVTGGVANRQVTWFLDDNAIPTPVPVSTDLDIIGSKVVFARVSNTITGCTDKAQVNLNIKSRPVDQVIQGSSTVCENDQKFYNVVPLGGASYAWNIPALFQPVFLGGGSTDPAVVLQFGTSGMANIGLTISVNGCAGNPLSKTVTVNPGASLISIIGPAQVCETDQGIQYEVSSINTSSNYNWQITPSGGGESIVGQGNGTVFVNFKSSNVTLKVTETTSSSCPAPNAPTLNIAVNRKPILALTSNEVCSEDDAAIIFTDDATSPVPAVQYEINPAPIVDPGLINLNGPTQGTVNSNGIALDRFENPTGGTLRVRYNVYPISADGCKADVAKTIILTVNPEPRLFVPANNLVCSGQPLNHVLAVESGSVPATQYSIDLVTPDPMLTAGSGNPLALGLFDQNALLDDVWINTSGGDLTVKYSIRPFNADKNCFGTPAKDIVFIIHSAPLVAGASKQICSGDIVDLTLASSNMAGAVNFAWTVKSSSAGITGANAGAGPKIIDMLTNNSGVPGTVVYAVTATSQVQGCAGPAQDVTITVNPAPSVTNISQTVCSDNAGGTTSVVNLTSLENTIHSGGGVVFEWFDNLNQPIAGGALTAYPMTNDPVFAKVSTGPGTCSNTATIAYTINPLPSVNPVVSNYNGFGVQCKEAPNNTNGQITATALQGTAPYQYSINGGTNFFSTNSFNSLGEGFYVIKVKDSKGCIIDSPPINVTAPSAFSISGSSTPVLCKGDIPPSGSVTITASGGVTSSPYLYSLDGSSPGQVSNFFGLPANGVSAGIHTITVTDINGCSKSTTVNVIDAVQLDLALSPTNLTCFNSGDGKIDAVGSGGATGAYLYSINNSAFSATSSFTGLSASSYTIKVQDNNGCVQIASTSLTQPAELKLNLTTKTDVTCFGLNNGALTVAASGGTPLYTYSIDNFATSQANNGVFNNLTFNNPGYTVSVRDQNNCPQVNIVVPINQPTQLIGSIASQTNVLCAGGNTGSVTVTGVGGTGSYSFAIDGVTFGPGNFPGLVAGSYTITIKDQNGCAAPIPVTITEPLPLVGGIQSQTNASCNGFSDGAVTMVGSDGTAPYRYSIDGSFFNTTGNFTGLSAGNYNGIVEDKNGCQVAVPFTIFQPTVLVGTIFSQTPATCKGTSTGSVEVIGSGGTAPYDYRIDNGAFSQVNVFPGLPAGLHIVRVRDTQQCFVDVSVTITEPTQFVLSVQTQVNPKCNGETGSITLLASGGIVGTGYQYSMNPGGPFVSDPKFEPLVAGFYTFYGLDGNGCQAQTAQVEIKQPDLLTLVANAPVNVDCHGQSTGSITVNASGGVGSYEYSKDGINFGPLNVFSGLSATGSPYTITVRDGNGCIATTVVPITEPPAISGTISNTHSISCFLGDDGEVTVAALGGTGIPTFTLLQDPSNTSGTTSGVFSGLRTGTYSVRITDEKACSFTTAVTVLPQPTQVKVTAVVTSNFNGFQVSCENAHDGVIQATATGGTGSNYLYSISPDPNNVGATTSNTFTNLPAGFYSISVTDGNSCPQPPLTASTTALISAPFPFSPGFIGFDQFVCIDKDPALIQSIVPPFGGTLDYVFQWMQSTDNVNFTAVPGANSMTFDPSFLTQTTYFKRVVSLASGGTQADGCGSIESNVVKITINVLPTVAISATPPAVCQGDPVFVTLTFTGQAPLRYDYTAANVFGTNTFIDRVGGTTTPIPVFNYQDETTFTVTRVKDFNGCEIFPTGIEITPAVLRMDPSFTILPPAQCSGNQFKVQYNADPAVTYNVSWSDGSPDDILSPGSGEAPHTYNIPSVGGSTLIPVVVTVSRPGCQPKSSTQTLTLYPSVLIAIPPVDNVICSGETINFENATDGATIHKWYYRVKGSNDELFVENSYEPSYTFTNTSPVDPIVYEVVYEGSNVEGCTGRTTMDITVYKSSVAEFDPVSVPLFTGGSSTVVIENKSVPAPDAAVFSYAWTFGLNSTPEDLADDASQTVSVVYDRPGAKKVTLVVTNKNHPECTSTHSETITIVIPPLTANFTATPLASCVPTTITVSNVAGAADKFDWVLEDENGVEISASNLVSPSFDIQEAGTYSITLKATLISTSQSVTKTISGIEVFGQPFAIFTARPKAFFVPDTPVDLINDSEGANLYDWDFGDGSPHSIEIEPGHLYAIEGNYTITLTASNDHGSKDIDGDGTPDGNVVCSDVATQDVVAREGGATKIPNAFTPNVNGPGASANNNGSEVNDVFLPITNGVQEFLMQIYDRWGNIIFESKDKNVGWDGYDKNGRLLPAGVYVYKLTLRLADDQRETRIGDITMIR